MGASSELHVQLQDYLFNICENVENGELSNLDGLIALRENREQLERSMEIIKEFETKRLAEIATEASSYPKGYRGYLITETSGRKLFDFKKIPEWNEASENLKSVEAKYKSMFDAKIKGNPNANISEDGEILPLPEINYTKSFLTVKLQGAGSKISPTNK